MSVRKKHITSIDDVLKWLGVTYSPELPDPITIDSDTWIVPVLENIDFFLPSEKTFPPKPKIKSKRYRKNRIISPNGGTLLIWEEEPF